MASATQPFAFDAFNGTHAATASQPFTVDELTGVRAAPAGQPFAFDAFAGAHTAPADSQPQLQYPGSSAAAALSTAFAAPVAAAGRVKPEGVECTVELVMLPGGPGGGDAAPAGGGTVRTTLNLAALMSFDALHCSLAGPD
jgi:hypothetical protein